MKGRNGLTCLAMLCWPLILGAQTPELANILERLDRLERQNRTLSEEVRALRAELAASRGTPSSTTASSAATEPGGAGTVGPPVIPTVQEKVEIQEQRIGELAQTKVESSQKFPIRLSGFALFNAFLNSSHSGGVDYPTVATAPGPGHAGATMRQTILGLELRGPKTIWDGQVRGSAYMDFFTGSNTLDQYMRLRTASVRIDWKTRSVVAGIEKPIFNPREPSSLAQVGVSPLTGAGNLWLWLPQVRFEQGISLGRASGLRAQLGVVQTQEIGAYPGSDPVGNLERSRPGLEGRFEVFHKFDEERRFEIAPGFHTSSTHVSGGVVPSNLFSIDWFFNPWPRIEFTGAFFSGQNIAILGSGGISQGFASEEGHLEAVHSQGGWGQLTLHAARRLDFHLFNGQQDDGNFELLPGAIHKNLVYGGNFFYHLAPNVVLALEATQLRTVHIATGVRINNHYDLALAYFF